ncbi:porin family protein [Cytophagaceae bacterium YF14B1]|uniref:Porin family protein n=1 Tax=Xanthocytophaga flava TaxID=3048013 RepID=A0AAE3U4X0_9BACT|nr:porin family protein [Xanthocytophaga flavus]MDJ1480134.1 porin family protein [Xanthocytophaga flavus]
MKKIALLFFAAFLSVQAFSQVKLGFKFSPAVAFNSAVTEGDYDVVGKNGSGLRFSAGPVMDFFFADNYAFHTGLWYTVKRSGIEGTVKGTNLSSVYNMQYLQIPVALKFFTNEIATDMKIYFLIGGTLDAKLAEKPLDKPTNYIYKSVNGKNAFRPADAGLLLGAGSELIMGTNTAVFFGLSYNRGLVNALGNNVKNGSDRVNDFVKVRNSLFSLDLGVKF